MSGLPETRPSRRPSRSAQEGTERGPSARRCPLLSAQHERAPLEPSALGARRRDFLERQCPSAERGTRVRQRSEQSGKIAENPDRLARAQLGYGFPKSIDLKMCQWKSVNQTKQFRFNVAGPKEHWIGLQKLDRALQPVRVSRPQSFKIAPEVRGIGNSHLSVKAVDCRLPGLMRLFRSIQTPFGCRLVEGATCVFRLSGARSVWKWAAHPLSLGALI